MQQPSIAEIRELILMSEASIDYQIQFWLTVTFATIVASFAARRLLTKKLRALITALYLTATFVFASRWYYEVIDLLQYQDMLDEVGFENVDPLATAISRIVLMLLGTFATVYFVYFGASQVDPSSNESID
jgi:hypothetical protein